MQLGDRRAAGGVGRRLDLDLGVQRRHGDGHVRRVDGDAGLAGAQDGVHAVVAAQRRAAAARLAFVAGHGDVIEIRAARALQEIAGRGRLVAELRRGAVQQGLRQHGIALTDPGIGREVGVAHQGTDAEAAVGRLDDVAQGQARDVDEMGRPLDIDLHEIEQVGAAGHEGGARLAGRLGRGGDVAGAFVGEGPHPALPCWASMMAATMLG